MHTSHTYHCHEHDAHKEHTHGRIFFRYRAQQIIDIISVPLKWDELNN